MKKSEINRLEVLPKRLPRKSSAAKDFGVIGIVFAGSGGRHSSLPYKKMNGIFARHAIAKWNSQNEN